MDRFHRPQKAHTKAKAADNSALKLAFVLLLLIGMFYALPAFSQESADAVLAEEPLSKDMKKRMELAREMHEIWPIRVKVEKGLSEVAQTMAFSERAKFKAAMRRAIDFEQLERDSIKIMAETFNQKELQGMVDFYGSSTGRAVSAKVDIFQEAIQPTYIKMLDKALLDIRTGIRP